MIAYFINSKIKFVLMITMTSLPTFPDEHNFITAVDKDLEVWNMQRLADVQATPGLKVKEIESDGCSGGLSLAWQNLADTFPAFKSVYGEQPPWVECCVIHDEAYRHGDTQEGFEKRLEADRILKQCVLDYGEKNRPRLSKKFDIPESRLETEFDIVAELMYKAVRLGGKPCSYLSWRWGFGWPHCPILPSNQRPLTKGKER